MKSLYLECNAGISGDMLVAALLDLGADKEALDKALQSIPAKGFEYKISRVSKAGVDCCDFDVILDEEHANHDHDMAFLHGNGDAVVHSHEHEHEHHHAHDHEHEHEHHHDHDHEGGEVEEYGIGTFVYYRRPAFDLNKFDWFVSKILPKSGVIRAKGLCYFSDNTDMSCLFEQAGKQIMLREAGQWYATAPEEELIKMMRQDPTIMKDWDAHYGDRMQKLVFIGQHMDKEQICKALDTCLAED